MAAERSRCGHYIFALWFLSFFLLLFFPRLISAVADWMSTILLHMCGLSANLECRSEMCCTRLADAKTDAIWPSGHHLTSLSGYIFTTKARLDNREKLLNSNMSHMSSQYGELRPTNGWGLFGSLGHPCKFQRVSRLGRVTARHSSGRQPIFAALNRGCHLYSTGGHHVGHWSTF